MLPDLLGARCRITQEIGLPESENAPTAGADVSVLAAVEGDAPADPRFSACSLPVVPIVAVELDDQHGLEYKGVGRELAIEDGLPVVVNAEAIEQCVSRDLSSRYSPTQKSSLRGDDGRAVFRILVAACNGAVLDVVLSSRRSAGRPAKFFSAGSARVLGLVAALIQVVAGDRAEPTLAEFYAGAGYVKVGPAPVAGSRLASASGGPLAGAIARQRTVLRARSGSLGYGFPATRTGERADFIARRSFCHRANSTSTINPIGVMR